MAEEEIGNYLQHVYITDIDGKIKLAINAEDKWSKTLPKKFDKVHVEKVVLELCSQHGINYIGEDTITNAVRQAIYDYRNRTKPNTNEINEELPNVWVQKYSGDGQLHESVMVNGVPFFLQIENGRATLKEKIYTNTTCYNPPSSFINKPYEFASLDEIERIVEEVKKETLGTLYSRTRTICAKYVDPDSNDELTIIAADILFTYFQDKIGQTHYLLFVGDTGTGKSNRLRIIERLGYRAIFNVEMTAANIYSYLGTIEEGQGTILEDEMDSIDRDPEKMRIWKSGYNGDCKVMRIDSPDGNREQKGFWTFCFKASTAEQSPDNNKAKGLMERTLVVRCSIGSPLYDISEVARPAGDPTLEALQEELSALKKTLLVYRLLHYDDQLPNIETQLRNREKQLCKPLLRLFYNETCKAEIAETLGNFLNTKRENTLGTLEAKLYQVISRLMKNGRFVAVPAIWEAVTTELNAEAIPNTTQSIQTPDHGKISQKRILGILQDKFGAKDEARQGHNNIRMVSFDEKKFRRLGMVYGLATDATDACLLGEARPPLEGANHTDLSTNNEENVSKTEACLPLQVSNVSHLSQTKDPEKCSFCCMWGCSCKTRGTLA